ncbi:hypothetical protein B0H10DRAFT_2103287 [Mycena sp. CBHHK59/15]|nr:hypothetical protein B0H10DRAFT_2103287 [Mycena sp. CBHHK59/15]
MCRPESRIIPTECYSPGSSRYEARPRSHQEDGQALRTPAGNGSRSRPVEIVGTY